MLPNAAAPQVRREFAPPTGLTNLGSDAWQAILELYGMVDTDE